LNLIRSMHLKYVNMTINLRYIMYHKSDFGLKKYNFSFKQYFVIINIFKLKYNNIIKLSLKK